MSEDIERKTTLLNYILRGIFPKWSGSNEVSRDIRPFIWMLIKVIGNVLKVFNINNDKGMKVFRYFGIQYVMINHDVSIYTPGSDPTYLIVKDGYELLLVDEVETYVQSYTRVIVSYISSQIKFCSDIINDSVDRALRDIFEELRSSGSCIR